MQPTGDDPRSTDAHSRDEARAGDGIGQPGAAALDRLRSLCALLPEVAEIEGFRVDGTARPTFRVATRGFAAYDVIGGRPSVTVKLAPEHQAAVVARPGAEPEDETGPHGWTVLDIETTGWDRVDELVVASYRVVAPPDYVSRLDALLG